MWFLKHWIKVSQLTTEPFLSPGDNLIDAINNKARSFGPMQNTVKWCSDWFWYTSQTSWRKKFGLPDQMVTEAI